MKETETFHDLSAVVNTFMQTALETTATLLLLLPLERLTKPSKLSSHTEDLPLILMRKEESFRELPTIPSNPQSILPTEGPTEWASLKNLT